MRELLIAEFEEALEECEELGLEEAGELVGGRGEFFGSDYEEIVISESVREKNLIENINRELVNFKSLV